MIKVTKEIADPSTNKVQEWFHCSLPCMDEDRQEMLINSYGRIIGYRCDALELPIEAMRICEANQVCYVASKLSSKTIKVWNTWQKTYMRRSLAPVYAKDCIRILEDIEALSDGQKDILWAVSEMALSERQDCLEHITGLETLKELPALIKAMHSNMLEEMLEAVNTFRKATNREEI